MLNTIKRIANMGNSQLAFIFFTFSAAIFILFSANRFMDLKSDPSKFIGTIDQYHSYMEFSKILYAVGMGSSFVFIVLALTFISKMLFDFFKR
jgi:hypothetical protein